MVKRKSINKKLNAGKRDPNDRRRAQNPTPYNQQLPILTIQPQEQDIIRPITRRLQRLEATHVTRPEPTRSFCILL